MTDEIAYLLAVGAISAVIFIVFRILRMWSRGHREQMPTSLNRVWPAVLVLLLLFLIQLVFLAATVDHRTSFRSSLLTISYVTVTLGYLIVFLRQRS